MKNPPNQTQNGGAKGMVVKNRDNASRTLCSLKINNGFINSDMFKVGKQQLVLLNGDSIRCDSIEGNEALTCNVTPVPNKNKSKALCVHIRENKWYDAGNVVSVGVAGTSLSDNFNSVSLAYNESPKNIYSLDEISISDKELSRSGESLPSLGIRLDLDTTREDIHQHSENNSPRGSLPRSCSSTVSSLSECSAGSNGAVSEDGSGQTSPGKSSKLWPMMFNMFSWKSSSKDTEPPSPTRNSDRIGSSLALIEQGRPANLPAKSIEEEEMHRKQVESLLEAARKRERREERERRQQREQQLREEERLAEDSHTWVVQVLPRFYVLRDTRRVRDLWWRGLPPSVRGRVWRLAIGNGLNLTSQLYELCLERAQAQPRNESLAAIRLDVARTFPSLCVFQETGPLAENLRGVLAAYALYRPDIGYVQGMSFIGAVLALNMDAAEAFICFANLLNRPCHLAAFTLDQRQMGLYYKAYSTALAHRLPKLYAHFLAAGLSPDLYLLDWLYTVYAKAMPLDIASRVWDIFLRDGDEFLFRTALGLLHLYQDELLRMDFVRAAQFLNRLPENMQSDALFNSINQMSTSVGAANFYQMLAQFATSV
ncbi:hypothetical protein TKK_0016985 [Trichogramma kaykai]|uniref:Rab-GAP TBC domain-containing protein n=1 Tax=Trichogramma kaykai TaxID=54128 RepID=A0ABD2W4D7_9HYME